ncbi:endonuclease/exonuclease/phosphatase family protein [Balneicella halophila]|uniref:Endonuclease/exonuclease/phosphatase family protein n=2 Tax=Balneicella halophila TaxID=1537566 RepID=A0A7L4UMN4_BALHA|nr:endonuclease/exonuclease/phosphatase family protein [Balneicella halophila]
MKHLTYLTILYFFSILGACSSSNSNNTEEPTPAPPQEVLLNLDKCIVSTSDEKLEIVTWNIENFPKGTSTAKEVAKVIKAMDVDVLALQEVTSKSTFEQFIALLPGYEGVIMARTGLDLAFIYKTSEISINGNPYGIYPEDEYHSPFPRRPFVLPIHSKSTGLDVIIVNNHLKAKSGAKNEARRRKASKLLKQWIDSEHPDDNVVILGDLNDEITELPAKNVFQVFLNDSVNYAFADATIAESSETSQWSYPSWPSHIDHIIITNELFDNKADTYTYPFMSCDKNYDQIISDHQPVCIVLK